ncbi:MAG: enoyl-CoA hydratase-related protein, partial [Candidatus Aminicenantaceae bacterium]
MTEIKYRTIVVTKKEREEVLWITFNRPKVHNAFNSEAILELTDAFDWVKADDTIRVVVLTGEG